MIVVYVFCSRRESELGFLIVACGREVAVAKLCAARLYFGEDSVKARKTGNSVSQ